MATSDVESDITFQQHDAQQPDQPPGELTSFQFVPEKITDFTISQEGQRSYRVRWKDSWLTEELLALTYQHLINEFWSMNINKDKVKETNSSKQSTNKQSLSTSFQEINPGNILGKSAIGDAHIDISDAEVNSTNQLDDGNLIKANSIIPSKNDISGAVSNDVSLGNLQYSDIVPTLLTTQSIPKYQQALQQPITVQQQHLPQDSQTGKVTFPKHVFSQARFLNKKQQQQIAVNDIQRVQCEICQKSLKTKKMLWAHKVAVHFGGNFPCEMCGKKCITAAELRRHMTSHSTERKFVCQYCGLAYKRWSHLYQHLRVHEEENNFRCDVCHMNFKVQSELKDHCFAEHTKGDIVQCSVCHHKLQTPLAVYHHSMKHTGTRDFVCDICSSTFKRKQHLVTHMKTHLTESRGQDGASEVYSCQACEENFTLKMDLKSHCDNVHSLSDGEWATCRTCEKKLKVSHSVYLHGLRHCGVREFQCTVCNQMFKRKAHLLRHQQDRHFCEPRSRKKRTNKKPTVCSMCRKSFKYKTVLIKHMTTQHGVIPEIDSNFTQGVVYKIKKKPFHCAHCPKRFKSKALLEKHELNKHAAMHPGMEGVAVPTSSATGIAESSGVTLVDIPISTMVNATEINSVDENNSMLAGVSKNEEYANNEATVRKAADKQGFLDKEDLEGKQGAPLIGRRVLTVDQETGQLVLMEEDVSSKAENEDGKVLVREDSTRNESESLYNPTQDDTQNNLQLTQNNVNTVDAIPISLGQIISQEGVTLQPVTGLSAHNLLDFGHANNEQIVVLLSALNAQTMAPL